ncbi:iron-sulfur cluster carrier protein ApbC [Thiohalorhabdus methylotrophus]|uniref:Iron-sulfur cluster carrier protein n=1 Tax=Thiohalorhabdus methylotrophus TaxID=3242694 RepID=A0ABV4TQS7_9GAMM
MATPTEEAIWEALRQVEDPDFEQDVVSLGFIQDLELKKNKVSFVFGPDTPLCPGRKEVAEKARAAVEGVEGVKKVEMNMEARIKSHQVQQGVQLMEGVKNVVAVASGKGGVGKSTTAVNLALGLAACGAKVGILDADIYGPSIPRMLGVSGKPTSKDGKTLEPKEAYGLKAMSIGFLIDEETPMVWRGPMVMQALEQLLGDTNWGELDYLVVDLPPGTGDTQLTLSQKVPLTGAVIVSTPQDIALLDARRGFQMFEKVGVPSLGIVENMSLFICPSCGEETDIFSHGGGQKFADDYGVEFLGSIPLDADIREQADTGHPTVVAGPDSRQAEIYRTIANAVAVEIAKQGEDHSHKFPNISIQAD